MEGLDSKNDRFRDLETLESDDKRRQRSSKFKISGGSGEGEESDGSRKRTGGSRRSDYDSDDYEARKESRSKQIMKKQEDNSTLEKLSSWYEDGDRENKREGGYVRKSISKFSDKGMDDDRSRNRDRDRETVYLEREQNDQDKGRVSSEQGRSHKNRWDDTDAVRNAENVKFVGNLDIKRGKFTDIKPESAEELSIPEKEYGLSSPGERGVKSNDRDAERVDSEDRTRSRDKLDAPEEDNKAQIEQQERSLVNRDDAETRERSKSPLRTGSGHHERDRFDLEHERGIVSKRKEPEREGYRDDWSKPRSHEREWEVGHRHGRYGGRRDMSVKTSSMYGVSDVIEIQTKPFDRRNEPPQQSETKSGSVDNSSSIRYSDEGPFPQDQNSSRDENDFQKGQRNNTMSNRNVGGVEPGSPFNRGAPQGNRGGRGGRGRPAGRERESQQPYGVPMPMMGSSFGPIGMAPPGPMQPLNPSMSPSPVGPPMPPNIFMPTFPPMMNFLAVPPNLSPVPPGSSGPRFSSSIGNPTNPPFIFNQPPNISAPGVNAMVPFGRGQNQDKGSPYEFPTRTIRPPGKAPSRGEQNDYSQNFVDTGMRPQNFIRELELTAVVEDYPRLRELIQKKDEIVANAATAPMYHKCDLREHVLSPEFFGTKFDVILVDPPWEEYVHRAPGVTDHMEYWTFEEIMNLKIEAIADTPSFIFLWVGDGVGLEQGRQCLKKWGFRRCEDICWVKTNKTNATPGLRHDSHTLFQRSKEHCLMGIKGTVRRSTDGHVIHANIDTDVIIAEEPPYGSTAKPEDMYRIVEHFALGRRRLELFGEDHNIRSGWLTVGKGLSSSNFNAEGYIKNFADKDGKVWQGGGGRNPPPEAPHLVVTTPDIEALRPKSPMKNQMQLQQQSNSISIPTVNNTPNRIPTINQEASTSSFSTPGPWTNMEPFKGGNMGNEDRNFDVYGYNMNSGQSYEEYRDFESRRGMNLL